MDKKQIKKKLMQAMQCGACTCHPGAEAVTEHGGHRQGAAKPPVNVWALLRELGVQGTAPIGKENLYAWLLLKALYGLNDARKLWFAELKRCLESLGFHQCYIWVVPPSAPGQILVYCRGWPENKKR